MEPSCVISAENSGEQKGQAAALEMDAVLLASVATLFYG
jgi:hypothetical protein